MTGRSRAAMLAAMAIFGTVGIVRHYIGLPSGCIAMGRGFFGAAFLLVLVRVGGRRVDWPALWRARRYLVLSGAMLGANWILLFEAYRYTTVAVATLCYYMAPIFLIVVATKAFGEKLTRFKAACAAAALVGMVLVTGVAGGGDAVPDLRGVALGLGAAVIYAAIVTVNKKAVWTGSVYDKTLAQLMVSGLVLVPYNLLTVEWGATVVGVADVALLVGMGVVHTGLAYALYFGSMTALSAHTVALFSYLDPVVAIVLSALVLGEGLTPTAAAGAALILGSAFVGGSPPKDLKLHKEGTP